MRELELKPCPFCGGTTLTIVDERVNEYAVWCESCDAMGPSTDFDERDKFKAVDLWNKRVNE